jgi:hypothetical protein
MAYLGLCLGLVAVTNAAPDESAEKPSSGATVVVEKSTSGASTEADTATSEPKSVVISIERVEKDARLPKNPSAWLGVYADEASEALAAQLGLTDGAGLVVADINTNSPAYQAGLRRNDVLVEFDQQRLVLPAQLRKLVQNRKPGDSVTIGYFRAGKKQSAAVALGQAPEGTLSGKFNEFVRELSVRKDDPYWKSLRDNLPDKDELKRQLEMVKEALSNIHIDQKKLQEEINRSVQDARKGLQEALRHMTNAEGALEPARRVLEDLLKSRISIRPDAKVSITTRSQTVNSLVNTDDSGTYTIIASPQKHLTVHDRDGNLVFEGDIDTAEQQAKVPPDVWKKAEPMLDRLAKTATPDPE